MKTFVILLSCLVCCVTARRLGLTERMSWLGSGRQRQQTDQAYAFGSDVKERQLFLLDVLLQVQKPLVNNELIQMGEVLVTEPNMYIQPNDVILQDFLEQARNHQIIGRNDAYNPVDMKNILQLVGLQRFFVVARDFNVFQRNVAHARLYFNAIMFVDALALAIRERPDTQDLVMPPMNEILPELYYDNDVLYSAGNVNFESLVNQIMPTYSKPGLFGFLGALLPFHKYGTNKPWQHRRMQSFADSGRSQFGVSSEIAAKIVLPVENPGGLSTELSNDIHLDIAWKNIIIDQLTKTATESIASGQQYHVGQIEGYGSRKDGVYGAPVGYTDQSFYQRYGSDGRGFVDINEFPQVMTGNGYSNYVNPFLGPQNQYGYGAETFGHNNLYGHKSDGQQYQDITEYGYRNQKYGGQEPQYKYGYNNQKYGTHKNQPYNYGVNTQYSSEYQRDQAYKINGQQGVVNIEGMPVSYDDAKVVQDRRNPQSGSKRSQHKKSDKNCNTQKYDNFGSGRSEIAQTVSVAEQLNYERRGEILLQSIQELAARFNMERYVQTTEGYGYELYSQEQQQVTQLMQQIRSLIEEVCQERGVSEGSVETLNIIADIINGRLTIYKQRQLSHETQSKLQSLQQQIAQILGYQGGEVSEITPLALFFGNLREPLTQQIIVSVAQVIGEYRQQLQPYTKQQLIGNGEIVVGNVQIDPLITYTEYYDADLINLLDQQLLQSNTNNLQRLSQKVVARQERLNHEPFTMSMDIESERSQEVVVRILLVPQIDYSGRRVSLVQNRENYIVIDAFVEQLQTGKNYIQRSSRQFNGYSNDVTTISQLYRQVMTGQITKKTTIPIW